MRTVVAGARAVRRAPLSIVPFVVQGAVAGALVASGAWPAGGSAAYGAAAFPFGTYFDVKQALASSTSWIAFASIGVASIAGRALVLGGSAWLLHRRSPVGATVVRASVLTVVAFATLVPAAGLFFAATAIRYAPFAWIGAAAFALAMVPLARRAAVLGREGPGRGVTAGGVARYGLALVFLAAVLDQTRDIGPGASALVLALTGPVHGLFFLGWRQLADEGAADTSRWALALVAIFTAATVGMGVYDRYVSSPRRYAATGRGSLLLLGGVDSTSKSGALVDMRSAWIAAPSTPRVISYAGPGRPYRARDTHIGLDLIARRVAPQIARAAEPRAVVGHSQAALILDRLIARGLASPERVADLAPTPPAPPPLAAPAPERDGPGRPGADLARAFAGALDLLGLRPFDIDAAASPVHVDAVRPEDAAPRLAAWALGDSVWLYGDWRRPGAVNVVALSDHVGITRDGRALDAIRRFVHGRTVAGDESSWRGFVVEVVQVAFAPWRPERP